MKYSSVGSAVAFLGHITLFEDRRPSEKRPKFCIERHSPVILRILMYGEVDKIEIDDTLFPNSRHILCRNKYSNNITVKQSPWYCGRDHSNAFAY